ncbi:ATP-dependent RNA helicase DDX55, partial [Paramuricea clavata]
GLFSATQTDELEALVRAGLRNPVRITVQEKNNTKKVNQRTPVSLENYYLVVSPEEKMSRLVSILRKNKEKKLIIFFSTCACVDYLAVFLK